ncbi:MAG: FAD-dependent monooxygenase [Actinomycetota bacterium]|nr:FAD-dependent monooxygenase [Actinomycetota bacterium]
MLAAGLYGMSVAVVGGGPVGLTLALRLAQFGVPVTVLEKSGRLRGEGSKALCMQRETLESWAMLGLGRQVADRGVAWQLGRTYFRETELFQTQLPATDEHFPPFVNVSQTEVEQLMVEAVEREPLVTVHWGHSLAGLEQDADGVRLTCQADAGEVVVEAAYAVGADGARSVVRQLCGIEFPGHSHRDQFLIADIRAQLPFPAERRFWFDPPWNPGRTVLIHPQPDDVWRIDWQVPPEFDLAAEQAGGRLDERIRQIVGGAAYEPVWLTVYRFHQRMADRFRDRRVLLAGDAAHLMSPFGARGLNSGVADAMNLAWRLAFALGSAFADASAPEGADELLDGYAAERMLAARENLAVTDATMRFMVPGTEAERRERDAILLASVEDPVMRAKVNSGRLATPTVYAPVVPGLPVQAGLVLPDAPVQPVRGTSAGRLRELVGTTRLLLHMGCRPGNAVSSAVQVVPADADIPGGTHPVVRDVHGRVAERLQRGAEPVVLTVRPDAYVEAVTTTQ